MKKSVKQKPSTRARAHAREPDEAPAIWLTLDELVPWADNPRANEGEPVRKVVASIKRFGFGPPIVARAANREIIAGHTRYLAARELGLKRVPVRLLDLGEDEAHLLAVADNRLGELATWKPGPLVQLLQSRNAADQLLAGWKPEHLTKLLRELATEQSVEQDEVPELPVDPVTRVGDVWTLGRHRLVCGSCTQADSWRALGKIDAVFTSPPYGLSSTTIHLRGPGRTLRDSLYDAFADTPVEWLPLMRDWIRLALKHATCVVVNVQLLAGNKRALLAWLAENADRFCDLLVWDKQNTVPAIVPNVCNTRFEMLVAFGSNDASRALPFADFRATLDNVYVAPGVRLSDKVEGVTHDAMFPVHLPAFVMSQMCAKAKVWCDPFCGTGTSIVAAEQLDRTCVGIELSPAYCDVIVERWQALTGQKAVVSHG